MFFLAKNMAASAIWRLNNQLVTSATHQILQLPRLTRLPSSPAATAAAAQNAPWSGDVRTSAKLQCLLLIYVGFKYPRSGAVIKHLGDRSMK